MFGLIRWPFRHPRAFVGSLLGAAASLFVIWFAQVIFLLILPLTLGAVLGLVAGAYAPASSKVKNGTGLAIAGLFLVLALFEAIWIWTGIDVTSLALAVLYGYIPAMVVGLALADALRPAIRSVWHDAPAGAQR